MRLPLAQLAPWGAGLAIAAPVVVARWPPSSDLSLHEGMIALLASGGDATFAPPGLYEPNLGHTNQLLYAVAWPLAKVFGSRAACKIVLAAAIAATIGFAARLLDHAGRSRWAAFAMAPVALGWALYWGFLPQMIGFALWLGALPLLDRAAAATRGWKDVVRAAGVTILIGFAHATSMACACVAMVAFVLVRPADGGATRTAWKLAPAAIGAAWIVAESRWEHAVETPLARVMASRVLWYPVASKVTAMVANLVGPQGAIVQASIALLAVVAVALWRVADRVEDVEAPQRGVRAALERHRMAVLAGALFALYLAAPYSMNFGAMLYARFLAPAYALAIVALAPPRGSRGALVAAPAVAIAIAPVVALLPQMAAASAQAAAVEPLFERIDRSSSVAVIHFGKHDRSLAFDSASVGNRVLAERGGRLLFSFAEYPIAPVVVRPEFAWSRTLTRLQQPGSFVPSHDLRRLRFVLVHAYDGALASRVLRAMRPEAELVEARGEWMLLRSTIADVPVVASDADAPADAETLQQRVNRQRPGG